MSCIIILAPIVLASWPALVASAAAAAAAYGFKMIDQKDKGITQSDIKQKGGISQKMQVEVELEESELLADKLKNSKTFSLVKDDSSITFFVNKRNKFAMHVSSKNKTYTELREIGKQLYNKIKQQYAYTKLITELKKKGYNIAQEERTSQGNIRIKFSKF